MGQERCIAASPLCRRSFTRIQRRCLGTTGYDDSCGDLGLPQNEGLLSEARTLYKLPTSTLCLQVESLTIVSRTVHTPKIYTSSTGIRLAYASQTRPSRRPKCAPHSTAAKHHRISRHVSATTMPFSHNHVSTSSIAAIPSAKPGSSKVNSSRSIPAAAYKQNKPVASAATSPRTPSRSPVVARSRNPRIQNILKLREARKLEDERQQKMQEADAAEVRRKREAVEEEKRRIRAEAKRIKDEERQAMIAQERKRLAKANQNALETMMQIMAIEQKIKARAEEEARIANELKAKRAAKRLGETLTIASEEIEERLQLLRTEIRAIAAAQISRDIGSLQRARSRIPNLQQFRIEAAEEITNELLFSFRPVHEKVIHLRLNRFESAFQDALSQMRTAIKRLDAIDVDHQTIAANLQRHKENFRMLTVQQQRDRERVIEAKKREEHDTALAVQRAQLDAERVRDNFEFMTSDYDSYRAIYRPLQDARHDTFRELLYTVEFYEGKYRAWVKHSHGLQSKHAAGTLDAPLIMDTHLPEFGQTVKQIVRRYTECTAETVLQGIAFVEMHFLHDRDLWAWRKAYHEEFKLEYMKLHHHTRKSITISIKSTKLQPFQLAISLHSGTFSLRTRENVRRIWLMINGPMRITV